MWAKLKETHPVLYEAIQWAVMALALAALVKSFVG
jgi:hypothetical protein